MLKLGFGTLYLRPSERMEDEEGRENLLALHASSVALAWLLF